MMTWLLDHKHCGYADALYLVWWDTACWLHRPNRLPLDHTFELAAKHAFYVDVLHSHPYTWWALHTVFMPMFRDVTLKVPSTEGQSTDRSDIAISDIID